MKLFNLATCLSILSIASAQLVVITEVKVETVYPNGTPVAVPVSSTDSISASDSASAATTTIVASNPSQPEALSVAPTLEASSSKVPTTLVSKTASSTAASATSTGDLSEFAQSILDAHNEKRALHSADDLVWDDELASYAADYASSYDCSGVLTHSGGPYGENLAVGYSNGVKSLEAWYDEGTNYDYSTASSFDHFTQVIWKGTTKLGCAQKDCSSNNWGKYVICSYDPAGNVIGEGKANLAD